MALLLVFLGRRAETNKKGEMRIIKFRAWDKKENTMWQWNDIKVIPNAKDEHTELMQFTGLLDKNGKEIYEGDIIHYDMPMANNPQTAEIVWSEKECGFTIKRGDYMPKNDWNIEVIGNIYENPELIKTLE